MNADAILTHRTFTFPAALVDRLNRYTKAHDLAKSVVMRAALDAYLREHEEAQAE